MFQDAAQKAVGQLTTGIKLKDCPLGQFARLRFVDSAICGAALGMDGYAKMYLDACVRVEMCVYA
jgi:hypothetical protein